MVLTNSILEVGGVDPGSGWVTPPAGERLAFHLREALTADGPLDSNVDFTLVSTPNIGWYSKLRCSERYPT